jgi:hypothetical protein
MPRPGINPQLSVERFFQLAVLCLVTSGYLAVAGSGYLDLPTVILTGLGLLLRALLVTGLVKLEVSERRPDRQCAAHPGTPRLHG